MTAPVRALWARGPAFWVVLVGLVVVGVLVVGRPRSEGPPLDPTSTGPLGTRALVLLLEELGATVDVTRRPLEPGSTETADIALVLADNLDDPGRAALVAWVREGGTLVVADPVSLLHPFFPEPGPGFGLLEAPFGSECEIPALSGVDRLKPPTGSVGYEIVEGSEGCFRRDGSVFVAVAPVGEGTVVAVGGAGVFVNQVIGEADNAVLVAALLAPQPGTEVAFLQPAVLGSGNEGLADLVSHGVRAALWQLALAFLVYAAWRARRLGRPVAEAPPVELDASELVVAVGHLLQQARHHDAAARLVGDDLRRRLAERLGLAGDAPADQVAEVAANRSGIPVDRILSVIAPGALRSADALVAQVSEAEAIGREVVHAS
ncbi:MAG: DUF4350 domain-containing protein [Acidimicrobiales bacterium]